VFCPDLSSFDVILINTSAGKDSQAMMHHVCTLALRDGRMSAVRAVHADLGRIEWPGTKELAEEHADHYGIPFEIVKREQVGDLLAEIRRRRKWPASTTRYCTSYYKRDQIKRVYTRLAREIREATGHARPRILNCLGFRAEESPRRRKMEPYTFNAKASSGVKEVWDWLPIHDWCLPDVLKTIQEAGTRRHPAYALGMTRLSCRFCIFAPKGQLMISGRANPELLDEYVAVEEEIGHKFRVNLSLLEVRQAIAAGERPEADDGAWNM
jgi:3'-phosphoadenosine 5'-phosphosulfate sulfotransferase (PAPS reductase)/FAD synthetase